MQIDEIRPTPTPRRVMVAKHIAASPDAAEKRFGIKPDVVFVRNDGWTLGAPENLASHAHAQWPETWIAFYRLDDMRVRPIDDFDS